MKNHTSSGFWKCFDKLPSKIQQIAKIKYRKFRENPFDPSLNFHPINRTKGTSSETWTVHVHGTAYVAVCEKDENGDNVWFYIGPHPKDY